MNATDIFNFNSKTTTFLNDNQHYFYIDTADKLFGEMSEEEQEAVSPGVYAFSALEHYNSSAEAFDSESLAGEQAEQFLHVAKYYKENGFYPHA
jgi:hypothetical protein